MEGNAFREEKFQNESRKRHEKG